MYLKYVILNMCKHRCQQCNYWDVDSVCHIWKDIHKCWCIDLLVEKSKYSLGFLQRNGNMAVFFRYSRADTVLWDFTRAEAWLTSSFATIPHSCHPILKCRCRVCLPVSAGNVSSSICFSSRHHWYQDWDGSLTFIWRGGRKEITVRKSYRKGRLEDSTHPSKAGTGKRNCVQQEWRKTDKSSLVH